MCTTSVPTAWSTSLYLHTVWKTFTERVQCRTALECTILEAPNHTSIPCAKQDIASHRSKMISTTMISRLLSPSFYVYIANTVQTLSRRGILFGVNVCAQKRARTCSMYISFGSEVSYGVVTRSAITLLLHVRYQCVSLRRPELLHKPEEYSRKEHKTWHGRP